MLKYILLGFLNYKPMTGYELKRLTTRFNGYGSTDAIMRDFQRYVLEIVKQRCEGDIYIAIFR